MQGFIKLGQIIDALYLVVDSSWSPPAFLLISRLIFKMSIELFILLSMTIRHHFPFVFDVFVKLMSQLKVILARQVDFVYVVKIT